MKKEENQNIFKIKPAARHILTIGRDLVKDSNTALIELVKNSYDADASQVEISLTGIKNKKGIEIRVSDDGNGMDRATVTGIWMVPSTNNKLKKTLSEKKKRKVQGRKGIGRYAASILGDNLTLETSKKNETTILSIDWSDFDTEKYLDEIEVSIITKKEVKEGGTTITILGDEEKLIEWDKEQIEDLVKALKRLVSPVHKKELDSDFKIQLSFKNLPVLGYENKNIAVEPFPILDVFDYRISGEILATGEATLYFENAIAGLRPEEIKINIPFIKGEKSCGDIQVDFKIYDLDTDSIGNLIERIDKKSLLSESGGKLSRNEARLLLKQTTGVSVYRNGFRIRPHGDPGYDWLLLDRERVQNPGTRVGSDRVSGFIEIESEEKSHLMEKSNREGLKENKHYDRLVDIATRVLLEAEIRRHQFKLKTGAIRSKKNITETLENLFDFSDVNKSIDTELEKKNVPKLERQKILQLISNKVEESNKVIEDVKQVIAIYQGQATLGKIVKVVLHEGRNPISYFQNEIPLIEKWIKDIQSRFDQKLLDQIVSRLDAIRRQAVSLVSIFDKISPLSVRRKPHATELSVKKSVDNVIAIFATEFKEKKINVTFNPGETDSIFAWSEDINYALVNLFDNSLYWLQQQEEKFPKNIKIQAENEGNLVKITYTDSGPGIEEKFIRDKIIFEPGFSTKPNGTGLGLAIAGEAIERSGGTLIAIYSNSGVHFEIKLPSFKK
jgi:signal transduction histidine kinase